MRGTVIAILAAFAIWLPGAALADATTEAQLRAALQTSSAQIATLEDQVANLQAAAAPQAALNKSLQAQLQILKQASSQNAAAGTAVQQEAAAGQLAALNRRLASNAAALAQSRQAYQQASDAATGSASQNKQLTAQLTALNTQNDHCTTANAQLYKISMQILDAYSHKDDLFSTIANREPFIGFKRVQLQNTVQSLGDKLYDNQLNPGATGP